MFENVTVYCLSDPEPAALLHSMILEARLGELVVAMLLDAVGSAQRFELSDAALGFPEFEDMFPLAVMHVRTCAALYFMAVGGVIREEPQIADMTACLH